jgi:hypothetical protein
MEAMRRVAFVLVSAALAPCLSAAEVTRLPNGNVSISARGTPLGTMLRQFDAIAPLDTSLVDPKLERATVDLAVQDVPLATALAASFDAAGVSYVVWGSDPDKLRIVAFSGGAAPAGEGQEPQTAKAYSPPPVPTEGYVLPNGIVLPPGISPDDPDVAMIGGPGVPHEGRPEDDPELAAALAIDPATQAGFPEDPNRKP